MSDLPNDLFSRAGASDHDREAWLAERATGVTATEVRELSKQGPGYASDLEQIKRGLKSDPFTGNKYTDHGKKREPVIAAKVERVYGILPESRVFHHPDNSQYLASPDGVGVLDGELVLAEIKTSGKKKLPGTLAFDESGYYDQIQWALFVTGAVRCLYVLEQCFWGAGNELVVPELFDWDDPDLQVVWVTRDEARISELKATADEFLERLDGDYAPPIIPEGTLSTALAYRHGLDQKAAGEKASKAARAELEDAYAGLGAAKWEVDAGDDLVSVSWKPAGVDLVDAPDVDAAREADPKLWGQLQRAEKALEKKKQLWAEHQAKFVTKEEKTTRPSVTVKVKARKRASK